MCRLKITNLSTLTDVAVVFRIGQYIANNVDAALCDSNGKRIINITKTTLSFGADEYTISDCEF